MKRLAMVSVFALAAAAVVAVSAPAQASTTINPALMVQYRGMYLDSNSENNIPGLSSGSAADAQSTFTTNASWAPQINTDVNGKPYIVPKGSDSAHQSVSLVAFIPALTDSSATAATSTYVPSNKIQSYLNGTANYVYDANATPTGSFAIATAPTDGSSTTQQCLNSSGTWGGCASPEFWHLVPSVRNDGSDQIEVTSSLTSSASTASNTCLIGLAALTGGSGFTFTCRGWDPNGDSYYNEGGGATQAPSWYLPGWATDYAPGGSITGAPLPSLSYKAAASLTNSINVCNFAAMNAAFSLTYTNSDANGTGYYLDQPDQSGSFPVGQCRSFDLPNGYIEGAIVVGEYGGDMSNTQHIFNGAGVNFTVEIHGTNQDSYTDMHTKFTNEGSIGTVDTNTALDTAGGLGSTLGGDKSAFADYLYLNYTASNPNIENAYHADIADTPDHPSWTTMEAKFMGAKIFGCAVATSCTNPFSNLGEPSITDSMKAYVNTTAPLFDTATNKAASTALNEVSAFNRTDFEIDIFDYVF